eukprot:GFUD01000802.1.p1 GENE.GFUD01000802.1~~GFUD01000802.1.p1  ORF type:complete len:110 (+),score=9.07 GFUD01000802.1:168-497(+)
MQKKVSISKLKCQQILPQHFEIAKAKIPVMPICRKNVQIPEPKCQQTPYYNAHIGFEKKRTSPRGDSSLLPAGRLRRPAESRLDIFLNPLDLNAFSRNAKIRREPLFVG